MSYAQGCIALGAFIGTAVGVCGGLSHLAGFSSIQAGLFVGLFVGVMAGISSGLIAAITGELDAATTCAAGAIFGGVIGVLLGPVAVLLPSVTLAAVLSLMAGGLVAYLMCYACGKVRASS